MVEYMPAPALYSTSGLQDILPTGRRRKCLSSKLQTIMHPCVQPKESTAEHRVHLGGGMVSTQTPGRI